jgi:hypothetical protein
VHPETSAGADMADVADNTNGYAEEYDQGFPLTKEDCECTAVTPPGYTSPQLQAPHIAGWWYE